MLKVLYEDDEILVVIKPAGVESQAAKRFAPDMVSEVKKHLVINKSCTPGKEPYVGVIHRLDKPVSGVMVYAKTKRAAAALSEQVQPMDMLYTQVMEALRVLIHLTAAHQGLLIVAHQAERATHITVRQEAMMMVTAVVQIMVVLTEAILQMN